VTVDEVLEDFRRVQLAHASQGAIDTEPDFVSQAYLASALGVIDREFRLPVTWEDWELYEGDGSDEAAMVLTESLRTAEARLKSLLGQNPRETLVQLRSSLWRVSR